VVFWRIFVGVLMLSLWEGGAVAGILDKLFFSRPSHVAIRLYEMFREGAVWIHLATTLAEAALSFLIGAVLGVVFGFLLARRRLMALIFEPYIRVANSLPRVVLAPIFLLWFGLGIWSKVALGVTVVFFIVFFNTYQGVRDVDPVVLNNARMLGASERQLTRHVLIPSALTWIFSSLHISIGFAIISVVVGEYLGSARGIGYIIAQAEGVFDTTGVFAGMVILAVFVLAVGAVVSRAERRLLRWKPRPADYQGI
jgi:NitT/TauT family transport system permease protein